MTIKTEIIDFIKNVLKNSPDDWLQLTTHRLDIYDESLAKTQFLEAFDLLFKTNSASTSALESLPTAYDYIRLGHPLSCVLEWTIAQLNNTSANSVISFSSKTAPILAILRSNLFASKKTRILYTGELPEHFNIELLRRVYGYQLEVQHVKDMTGISAFEGSTIFISNQDEISNFDVHPHTDFSIHIHTDLGSVLSIHGEQNASYISEIQHVRRRETIAMTPADCLSALKYLTEESSEAADENTTETTKAEVLAHIKQITGTTASPVVGSSGLSVQYAIMMGLIHEALDNHKGKAIKFIVPPNCYGGTNDQARRVAACLDNVEVVDLPVDGDNDMVKSIATVLDKIAHEDAVPYIIAEIPTNPRVEVPNLTKLKEVLSTARKTATGEPAVDPVFILDQTFCPDFHFLGKGEILSTVRALSYASGSKFPSGGQCTAGYCVANKKAETFMENIEIHLRLCDNEATPLQYEILAKQLPSMNQRIKDAYKNTRELVNFIADTLPAAKLNFVSEELAAQGFTPSVFSLDLPTKGDTHEERENYKRALNHKLINLMIAKIPKESKYCVSYGQLKGCYWTIPATSTQGTTKEGDKDYIARVSCSPDMDVEAHKKVFAAFVAAI